MLQPIITPNRTVGAEFGTTTGRPRRCGWLDIPQLRYSCLVRGPSVSLSVPFTMSSPPRCIRHAQVNGFTSLNLTKLDVLDDMDEIQVGVRYMYEGKELDSMPSNLQVRTEPSD